ncbi:MAG: erythromycin esterase family protein [Candidatus Saccharibacteria bacterium]|nr:erythromycin esterase family protein [Candidatus Saccharibacteria bacterium]
MKNKLKKFFKILLVLILLTLFGLFIFQNYETWMASNKIDEVEKYSEKVANIDLGENVDIVALGEATHGNKEFQSLKLELFEKLVEEYNFRALLFEMDYGEGLFINDFVRGKSNLTIDEIMNNMSFEIYRTKEIKELILWMKDYNLQKDDSEKLSFYGFDIQNPDTSIRYIIDNMPGLDDERLEILVGEIKLSDEKVQEAIEYLKTIRSDDELINRAIESSLSSYDYFETTDMSDYVMANNKRDKLMSDNVLWLYEFEKNSGNNKIMVAAHNGHIAKYDFNYVNMGNILKNYLGEKYYALGTDFFNTTCSIKNGDSRINFATNSANILAYQAKYFENENRYFLDFSKIDKNSPLYSIINSSINHGVLGEGYSIIMRVLPQTTRIKIVPTTYYDGMIFIYNVSPLDFLVYN